MTDQRPARRVTLQRHILESQQRHPGATGELSVLLTQLAYAGKIFHQRVPFAIGSRVEVARFDEFMGKSA